MKTHFLSALILAAIFLGVQGCHHNFVDPDDGAITGLVVDYSGVPISGATVIISPSSASVTCDNTGSFKFQHLTTGSYTLVGSKSGYGNGSATVAVRTGQQVSCRIVLSNGDNPVDSGNGALKFDGGDNSYGAYVKVPHSSDLCLNGHSYTLEAWFNPATIIQHSPWGQWIMNKGNSNDANEYLLGFDQGGTVTFWNSYTGTIWSSTRLSTNTWTHVAVVVDEDTKTATMYINGLADGSVHFSGNYVMKTTAPLFIGARNYFGQNYGVENWDGAIDEVRIWTVARTVDQIQSNKGKSLTGDEQGLLAYWKFNEASGSTVVDATGKGHAGTFVNNVVRIVSTAPIQ